MSVPADNAKHFPNDAEWQRHCKKVAEYLEATSKQEKQS